MIKLKSPIGRLVILSSGPSLVQRRDNVADTLIVRSAIADPHAAMRELQMRKANEAKHLCVLHKKYVDYERRRLRSPLRLNTQDLNQRNFCGPSFKDAALRG